MSSSDVPPDYLARAREVCLTLPEATEEVTWGHPNFRVRKKIFAGIGIGGDEIDATTMTMKAAPGEQQSLLAEGHPFFYPKYVGSKGWIGIVIDDDTDWDEVRELVTDSFRAVAPKTVARQLDDGRR